MTTPKRYSFGHAKRLHGNRDFGRVFDLGRRKTCGPLIVVGIPNQLEHNRMGLSVSRKVGNAVKRHRIKRLLREAFRLNQHDWPKGYDMVVVVRPHQTRPLTDYERCMETALNSIHQRQSQSPSQ